MGPLGYWYKSRQAKNTITSIKFVDSYTPTGSEDETWFADVDNGTVPETQITAYRTGTEVIVAGNGSGKIMANEDCSWMFGDANAKAFINLESLDVSILDTSKVTNMEGMFHYSRNLKSLDLSNFNTSNVTDMSYMFFSCWRLTSLDLFSFDTSKVTNMSNMFNSCSKLTSIYVGSGWNTDAVTNSKDMFASSTKLPNFNSSVVDKTNAHTGNGGYLTLKA